MSTPAEQVQVLRREAEALAWDTTPRSLDLANRIRFTVYAWQDEGLPPEEQVARLQAILRHLREGTAVTYRFTA